VSRRSIPKTACYRRPVPAKRVFCRSRPPYTAGPDPSVCLRSFSSFRSNPPILLTLLPPFVSQALSAALYSALISALTPFRFFSRLAKFSDPLTTPMCRQCHAGLPCEPPCPPQNPSSTWPCHDSLPPDRFRSEGASQKTLPTVTFDSFVLNLSKLVSLSSSSSCVFVVSSFWKGCASFSLTLGEYLENRGRPSAFSSIIYGTLARCVTSVPGVCLFPFKGRMISSSCSDRLFGERGSSSFIESLQRAAGERAALLFFLLRFGFSLRNPSAVARISFLTFRRNPCFTVLIRSISGFFFLLESSQDA